MISISGSSQAEIIEKKSRFIGLAYHVKSLEDITDFLSKAKSEYPNANHYTYAYVLDDLHQKAFDDSEPNRTAGYPILEVINSNNLNYVLLIVIRYFGGTLLGTGGLIRAYSQTAQKTIENAVISKKTATYYCKLVCSYEYLGDIDRIIRNRTILDRVEYDKSVVFYFTLDQNNFGEIKSLLYNHNNYQDTLTVIKESSKYIRIDYSDTQIKR
jgi:uncharacterized YigZ family protein